MPIPQLVPSKGESYDPAERPPPFGHALKQYFPLDEDYVNLNPGEWRRILYWCLLSSALL